ncbi:MAG: cation:proton antiporter [Acidimicrobiia bacterium]|nr:cation:proton antiporter [Acidimicrobiia bacterium]
MLAAAGQSTSAVLLELGLVFVGLAVLSRFARRLRLSPVPLYLIAGLAIGAGSPVGLRATDDFIEVAAEIGVILLLLLLGLEYTPAELSESLRANAPGGAMDLVLNFVPGFAAAFVLGWGFEAAFLLGGVTYCASSGIIVKTLGDLGRLGNRETPSVISLLVIEDLVMAVYLPVAAAIAAGAGGLSMVGTVAVGLAALGIAWLVAARHGNALSRFLFSRSDDVLLFSVLGVALVIAGIAEGLSVSAAVGAFLVGVAISDETARGAATLLAPLRDLFAAAFFVFFTFQVDAKTIPASLVPALALAVVTAATKYTTGWWTARRNGVGPAGRRRAGTIFMARGEFSIVIAALAAGTAINPGIAGLASTYVLILAIAGPVSTRFVK